MTREEQLKEIDALVSRASTSIDMVIDILLVPPLLALAVATFVRKTRSGMPHGQALDELAKQIRGLAEDYPSLREGLEKIIAGIQAQSIASQGLPPPRA